MFGIFFNAACPRRPSERDHETKYPPVGPPPFPPDRTRGDGGPRDPGHVFNRRTPGLDAVLAQGGDSGVAITLAPPGNENAKCLINVTFVPEPKPVPRETVDAEVLSVCDQFVDQSVEKKKVIRDFGVSGGAYGSYCVFTDASLVGKAAKHDEFKVIGVGIIHFRDDVMAAVSVAGDDEKGGDFAAMLAALKSAAVTAAK